MGAGAGAGMAIHNLLLLKRDLWMSSFMVNLHRLHVRCCNLAVRALHLGVPSLLLSGSVSDSGFAPAAVGGRGVDLGRDLLGCVLLRLGFACHL